jgi:DHA1 family bicyclomycin/chloramphenicol resistance-like MFS transporter
LNPPQTPARTIVLLGALIALPALGTDLYNPALPALAASLEAGVAAAQLTVTTYFIGLAGGQLVWGPLSDRLGRRPALLAGLSVMLVSSLAAALAGSVAEVAAARLGQGFAMSSGAVVVRSIVRDMFAHERAARLLASVTIVFSIVPIAAPLTGAALAAGGGWRAIFWFLCAAAAVLILATSTGLTETAPAERRSARPLAVARTLASIVTDRRFIAPLLLVLCSHIGILAWVSNSAFTLVRGLGVSILAYSLMFAGVMLGQILGAWFSARLVMRLGIARLLRIGVRVMLAGGVLAAALAWGGQDHWLAVVIPYAVFLFGTALVVPNATASALTPFPATAGAASSLVGAIGFTAGALVSTLLAAAFDGTARPMTAMAAIAGMGATVFEIFLHRGKA